MRTPETYSEAFSIATHVEFVDRVMTNQGVDFSELAESEIAGRVS